VWILAEKRLLLWLVQLRTRNAGLVDVGWAASLGGLGVLYALVASGAWPDRLLVGALAGFWGGRLAWHLLRDRVLGHPEEGRYVRLRAHWGRAADAHFVWFFQAQALLAAVLSLPFLLAACDPRPGFRWLEIAGVTVWLIGIAGEAIADHQLARFKADPANRGRVCQVGLWRYSRHPNYFFEWVIWCGFAALGLTAPTGWLALLETRTDVAQMLKMDKHIDLIVPRGSNAFVQYIMDNTNIPVLGHADGICQVYVDRQADLDMAVRVAVDSKCQYVAVCNAAETLLVHRAVAGDLLIPCKALPVS